MWERAVSVLFFPAVLGGALAIGARSLEAGGSTAPALIGAALAVFAAERLWPHRADWQRSHGDVLVDVAHVASVAATSLGVVWLVPRVLATAAAALAPLGTAQLWPAHWPAIALLPFALLAGEAVQYWTHRLGHEWGPLWRLHATHHSAPRLYFLNAARFHPLDVAIDTGAGLAPLVLLGCPPPVLVLFALFTGVFGYLQHCNVRVALGPLNYLFSMAELHRWHHAKDVREANTNYGSNLIVWDLVFGTFFWPKRRSPPEAIGLADLPRFPQSYWEQLASPFRWRSITAAGRSR
ncbi:MAG TPA: sterol desaturase family protein [Myxococcota bacterium]|nr:sterol desaturase family protein [Myxococcota bacterium]